MENVEKTVFISYRRDDESWALTVYQYLSYHNYDVFIDYTGITAGDFEQIILSNIKARAYFLIILTPSALDRCNEPGDWLRREIETAINEKRIIIPIFFEGFDFKDPSISEKLTGKLESLKKYQGLEVPAGYFEEAMERLVNQYMNVTLDGVLHPISPEVKEIVKEQQIAANEAILKKEADADNLYSQAQRAESAGKLEEALNLYYEVRKIDRLYLEVDRKIEELEQDQRLKFSGLRFWWKKLSEGVKAAYIGGIFTLIAALLGGGGLLITWIDNRPTPTPTPSCINADDILVEIRISKNDEVIATLSPLETLSLESSKVVYFEVWITSVKDETIPAFGYTWTNVVVDGGGQLLHSNGRIVDYRSGQDIIGDAISLQINQPDCPALAPYPFFILPNKE